jgi:hypothetical protein
MNKMKKLGKILILLPIILFTIIAAINIIDIPLLFLISNRFGHLLIILYEYSLSIGLTSVIIAPIYISIGLYLMIKYRDNKKPIIEILKEKIQDLKTNLFLKPTIHDIVILFAVMSPILIIVFGMQRDIYKDEPFDILDRYPLDIKYENRGLDNTKHSLQNLIPDEYEVIESEYEEPNEENDWCVQIYSITPKEYSETEKQYLSNAGLIYCEDISTAVLRGQVGEVRYNQTEGKWIVIQGGGLIDVEQYGRNRVSKVELGGSHASATYYIVRLDKSEELIILSIPVSNRIRCETYDEDGVESVNEECVDFITSLGMPPDSSDFVPNEIYENYYNELLQILEEIKF